MAWMVSIVCTPSTTCFSSPVPVPQPYRETVINSAPIAYWRFAETDSASPAADELNHYPLNYEGSSGGELGAQGALLPSSDTNPSLNLAFRPFFSARTTFTQELSGQSHFSIECWLQPVSFGDPIVACSDSLPSTGFELRTTHLGNVVFRTGTASSDQDPSWDDLITDAPLPTQWNHVVVVWDGAFKSVYVNAQLAAQSPSQWIPSKTADFVIGGGYSGSIDEVAFYTHSLSANEILTHYLASGRQPDGWLQASIENGQWTVQWTGDGWYLETTDQFIGDNTVWESVIGATSPFSLSISAGPHFFRLSK